MNDDGETRCWFCGGKMFWHGDFNYDEVFGEGDGVVAYLECPDCHALAQFSVCDDEELAGEEKQHVLDIIRTTRDKMVRKIKEEIRRNA